MPITRTGSTICGRSSTPCDARFAGLRDHSCAKRCWGGSATCSKAGTIIRRPSPPRDLPDRITIGDIVVRVADQPHGPFESAGLRFESGGKSIGYATDLSAMTTDIETLYQELDVWIVDALRRKPHPSHPDLATTLGWIDRFAPHRAILTHMDQSMDYATLTAELPSGVEPGYDGLEVRL